MEMKSYNQKLKILFVIIVMMLFQSNEMFLYAQSETFDVSGTVSDVAGPIPGVTVYVKGAPSKGTVTNPEGFYNIAGVSSVDTMIYSFVGMKTQKISVSGRHAIDITMENEAYSLEEVVAVGYGIQKKKSLTGAISSIDNTEIQTTTSTSLAQKLQGKVAGLNIRQNNAEPGSMITRLIFVVLEHHCMLSTELFEETLKTFKGFGQKISKVFRY